MQWLKDKEIHHHEKILTKKNGFQIYGILLAILIGSFYQLYEIGYRPETLLVMHVMPQHLNHSVGKILLNRWIYSLTGVNWNEPKSYLMAVTPYRQALYRDRIAKGEVKGYFDQDENTYLTQKDTKSYIPKAPQFKEQADYLAFQDPGYVYSHYFSAPSKIEFDLDMFEKWNFYQLVTKPIMLTPQTDGPQILIFHTHVREEYVGGLTVADIGEALAHTLESNYGIKVLHVTDSFYESSNSSNRPTGGEYERMEPVITQLLKDNPSISVVIDLHRDGVNSDVHLISDVDGKQAAKIMFVNGLCMNRNRDGVVEEKKDLPNPYIGDNLAFSLQMMVQMNKLYPGLSRKIYLNEWRYSTHMRPNSLLLEWGAQTNTSDEAINSVAPVAEILAKVLQND